MGLFASVSSRMTVTALLCAAVTAGAAACGGGTGHSPGQAGASKAAASPSRTADPLAGLSAQQIFSRSLDDLKAASSVRVTGSSTVSGQPTGIDSTLVHAAGCQGRFTMGSKGSFSFIMIGKRFWIKPDRQFYTSLGITDPNTLVMLQGHYVKTSSSSADMKSFSPLCDPSQLAAQAVGDHATVILGSRTTIDGQLVQELHVHDRGQTGTLAVSVAARPEFVQMTGDTSGQLAFTAYDQPVRLTAPPAGGTIDGSKLGM